MLDEFSLAQSDLMELLLIKFNQEPISLNDPKMNQI